MPVGSPHGVWHEGVPSAWGHRTKVTLAFSAWPGWFPWQVAQEQGLFATNGVDVELKYFDNYLDSLTALATGNVTPTARP